MKKPFNPWRTDIVIVKKRADFFSVTNNYDLGHCFDFGYGKYGHTIQQGKREFTTFLKRKNLIKRLQP